MVDRVDLLTEGPLIVMDRAHRRMETGMIAVLFIVVVSCRSEKALKCCIAVAEEVARGIVVQG
jgi:hypothetical protein